MKNDSLCSVYIYMRFLEAFSQRNAEILFIFSFFRFSFRAVDENDYLQRLYAFLRSVSQSNAESF
jgi:hypothetical protein